MKRFSFKYNVNSRGKEGNDNTWFLWENFREENGVTVWDNEFLVDHIEFHVPVFTIQKEFPGFGFGMYAIGELEWRTYPKSDKKFALITSENPLPDVVSPKSTHKIKGIKYHVPSQGKMQDNSWRIYNNLNKPTEDKTNWTHDDTIYTDNVEIFARSWTGETNYRIGYSLLTDGEAHQNPENPKHYVIDLPEV